MTGSMDDVTKEWAGRPLFDGELGKELDTFEKRIRVTPPSSRTASPALSLVNPSARAQHRSSFQAPVSTLALQLPPPIERPQVLTKMFDGEIESSHHRNGQKGMRHQARQAREAEVDQYSSDTEGDNGKHAHTAQHGPVVPLTDSTPKSGTDVNVGVANSDQEGGKRTPERGAPQSGARAWEDVRGACQTIDAHIRKAEARRVLKEQRLAEKGVRLPSSLVEGGCQTDPQPSNPSAAAHNNSAQPQKSPRHHPSNKTPPPSLLLEPANSFTVAAPNIPQMPVTPVQLELQPVSKVAPIQVHQAPRFAAPATRATVGDAIPPASRAGLSNLLAAAKGALMERLDQAQLKNEEAVVCNGAFAERPDASTAVMQRAALEHVGDAYRKEAPIAPLRVPLGGYRSVLEPDGDDNDRWKRAQSQIDAQGAEECGAAETLRAWTSDLTSASVPSSRPIPKGINKGAASSTGGSYNARKKWGNVSFALPSASITTAGQEGGLGPMEQISATTREFMTINP